MFNLHKLFSKLTKPEPISDQKTQTDTTITTPISISSLKRIRKNIDIYNKWAITKFAASGGFKKAGFIGGNQYPAGYTSRQRQLRRLKQIEKGIIQITPQQQEEA